MTEKRRRSRPQVEAPVEEPAQFFCPVAAQSEAFEERIATLEMRIASLDEVEGRVAELDEDLADEEHEARRREDHLQVRADALESRLGALELRAREIEALRQKLVDLEQEVLAVAKRALAAAAPTDIMEGASVWDRLDGKPCVAVAQTIVELREVGSTSGGRAHRVLGWVVRDATGGYRARPAAELSIVRPRVVSQSESGALRAGLLALVVAAVTVLLMLASTGR